MNINKFLGLDFITKYTLVKIEKMNKKKRYCVIQFDKKLIQIS